VTENEDRWRGFVRAGDDWLAMYAASCILESRIHLHLFGPQLFATGHAAELYLKAVRIKQTGDLHAALGRKHDVVGLLGDCQLADHTFMPERHLVPEIVNDKELFGSAYRYERVGKEYLAHFLTHQELYAVAHLLMDLKYMGAYMKRPKGGASLGAMVPSAYWTAFFSDARRYMQLADRHVLESLAASFGHLPEAGAAFLWGVYRGDLERLNPADASAVAKLFALDIDAESAGPIEQA